MKTLIAIEDPSEVVVERKPRKGLPRVAEYVHDVARFKNLVAAGQVGRAP